MIRDIAELTNVEVHVGQSGYSTGSLLSVYL